MSIDSIVLALAKYMRLRTYCTPCGSAHHPNEAAVSEGFQVTYKMHGRHEKQVWGVSERNELVVEDADGYGGSEYVPFADVIWEHVRVYKVMEIW